MKLPKALSSTRKSSIPALRFEKQNLNSYSGLVVFQKLFGELELSKKLSKCSPLSTTNRHTSFSLRFRLLIVNALLGMRKLREMDLYREDPIVRRTLGAKAIPSVPTISRMLESCDGKLVSKLQSQSREIVLERLASEKLSTITLDFDGSVISTSRKAEGVAAGFNRKKGMRNPDISGPRPVGATIRCSARWRKAARSSMFFTAATTFTTPTGRSSSSDPASMPFAKPRPRRGSRRGWTRRSSATPWWRSSIRSRWSMPSAFPSSASANSRI